MTLSSLNGNMCLYIHFENCLVHSPVVFSTVGGGTCLLCTCNNLIMPFMCGVLVRKLMLVTVAKSSSVGCSSLSVLSLTGVFPSALLLPPSPMQPQAVSCQRTSVRVGSSLTTTWGLGLRTSRVAWHTLIVSCRRGLLGPPASSRSMLAASYSVTTHSLISTPPLT